MFMRSESSTAISIKKIYLVALVLGGLVLGEEHVTVHMDLLLALLLAHLELVLAVLQIVHLHLEHSPYRWRTVESC